MIKTNHGATRTHRIEQIIGDNISLHPNILSGIKLFLITPLILLPFYYANYTLPVLLVMGLYVVYGILTYIDGIVARAQAQDGWSGEVIDRLMEYPLLIGLSYLVFDYFNSYLLLAKITIDGLIIVACIIRKDATTHKIRSGINYATVFILLLFAAQLQSRFITPELVSAAIALSIAVSLIVLGRTIGLLHRYIIADALSAGNLLCGVFAVYMATLGRVDLSLLFIGLGAAFDGLDGAAARKFGSTKWGVYSDDIADGVTYGIAPGAIIAIQLGSQGASNTGLALDGIIIGLLYALFTLGRLIYFTLNKSNSDPEYFMGAPSVFAGILVVAATYLFKSHHALIGMTAGIACVLMVTFDTRYKHAGRAIASRKSVRLMSMIAMILLLVLGFIGKIEIAISLIFSGCLVYGFMPMVLNFKDMIRNQLE